MANKAVLYKQKTEVQKDEVSGKYLSSIHYFVCFVSSYGNEFLFYPFVGSFGFDIGFVLALFFRCHQPLKSS